MDDHGRTVRVAQWDTEIPLDRSRQDNSAESRPSVRVVVDDGDLPDELGEAG